MMVTLLQVLYSLGILGAVALLVIARVLYGVHKRLEKVQRQQRIIDVHLAHTIKLVETLAHSAVEDPNIPGMPTPRKTGIQVQLERLKRNRMLEDRVSDFSRSL